jgi:hypothetical protein
VSRKESRGVKSRNGDDEKIFISIMVEFQRRIVSHYGANPI